MNRNLYKWHVYSALFVSAFFTILLFTGIANVFHGKIKQWENPQFFKEIGSDGKLLSPEQLYRKFSDKQSDYTIGLLRKIPGKDKMPIECILVRDNKEIYGYIDPVSAKLIGTNESPIHKTILKWHTSMMLGTSGHILMGLVGVMVGICLVTGLLYFIKHIRWKRVKKQSKKWHFGLGLLALIFNLMMVVTGLFLQYQEIIKPEKTIKYDYPQVGLNLDSVISAAIKRFPEVSFKRIKFPSSESDFFVLLGDQPGKWYLGSMPFELKVDVNTSEMISVKEEDSIQGKSWFQKTLFTFHSGQFGGNISRWIYLMFSLGTFGSILTGLYNYRQMKRRSQRI